MEYSTLENSKHITQYAYPHEQIESSSEALSTTSFESFRRIACQLDNLKEEGNETKLKSY
jgi:hypothetical protein